MDSEQWSVINGFRSPAASFYPQFTSFRPCFHTPKTVHSPLFTVPYYGTATMAIGPVPVEELVNEESNRPAVVASKVKALKSGLP